MNEPSAMQSKQVAHDVGQSNDFSRPRDGESALPVCEAKLVFVFVRIKNTRTEMRNNRHVQRERRKIGEGRKAFQKQAEGKNKVEFAK